MQSDYDGRAMTRPERFRFVMVLAVAAMAMAVASTCASCHRQRPVAPVVPQVRTVDQMHQAAVTIRVQCPGLEGMGYGYGSGVVVNGGRVLTAAHVVNCELGKNFILPASTIEVSGAGDEWLPAHTDFSTTDKDVAILAVPGIEKYGSPIELAPAPAMGARVCAASGDKPYYSIKCGIVQPFKKRPDANMAFDTVIEPGMSGSGTYDESGRLVGVVVELRACAWSAVRQICGAVSRSVWDLRTELGL